MSRRGDYGAGLALASTVSQVGCVTVIIIVGALLFGLLLDNLLGTKPVLTIILILVSIPISLFSVVRIALSAARRIQEPPEEDASKEGEDRETHA
jgi:F0F1-type ATP synthase assembly protein I